VRFSAEHDFGGSRAEVVDILCDPEFQARLDLPDLSRPEVLAHDVDGTTRVVRLRYEYTGQLDPAARKIIGNRALTWIQELRVDTSSYSGTLTFSAEQGGDRLSGDATVALTTNDGDEHTRRSIAGDLRVRVPLIGGAAERRIVPGVVRRLDVEAAAVEDELAARR
jgi:uncharacterized protein DUF2505